MVDLAVKTILKVNQMTTFYKPCVFPINDGFTKRLLQKIKKLNFETKVTFLITSLEIYRNYKDKSSITEKGTFLRHWILCRKKGELQIILKTFF